LNKSLNEHPYSGERAVNIDVAAVAAELNQASEALRRVAAYLERAGNGRVAGNDRVAPTSVGDRLTTKQLACIHAVARRAGLTKDALARELQKLTGSADPALLSRREASDVIDHLGRLADSPA
jgi:hypothetical protein